MLDYLSNRFGVEIEAYTPEGHQNDAVALAISARLADINAGCGARSETRTHAVRPHWKIVLDGSLGDYDRGIEAVSPILRGEAGLAQVRATLDALSDFGASVSKKCGLHVHVEVGNQSIAFFRRLVKLYAVYEPIIDAFMPPSRRASNNQYCRSMTRATLNAIDDAQSVSTLSRLFGDRFVKLNLTCHANYGTVEFRQHSGTLESNKALKWITFCLRLVEAAKQPGANLPSVPAGTVINRAPAGSKSHLIGELALRPEGVTVRDITEATGWREVSVPAQLRRCGLQFTQRRTGRIVHYYAQAAEATSAVQPTLDNLLTMLECSEEERAYFRTRTRNLSGDAVQWAA